MIDRVAGKWVGKVADLTTRRGFLGWAGKAGLVAVGAITAQLFAPGKALAQKRFLVECCKYQEKVIVLINGKKYCSGGSGEYTWCSLGPCPFEITLPNHCRSRLVRRTGFAA